VIRAALLALVVASGCGGPQCEAGVDRDVHTVVDVSWETHKDGPSWVEYGLDESLGMTTNTVDSSADGTHAFSLLGLPPLTDVFYKTVTDLGNKQLTCEGTVTTENLPAGLPGIEVTVDVPEKRSPEPYILGAATGDPNAIFVIDRAGNWLWYQQGTTKVTTIDVEFKIGDSPATLVYNTMATNRRDDVGTIENVSFDGDKISEVRTEKAHHVFCQGPDGALAWLAIETGDWVDPESGETVTLVGDTIRELAPDGTETILFDTWDQWEPARNDGFDTNFYPQGLDWTHANGINWNPDRGSYLISFDNIGTVIELDRASGTIVRQFGELDGSYAFPEGTLPFHHQHDPWYDHDGELRMMTTDTTTSRSGGIAYAIDDGAETATQTWSWGLDQDLRSFSLGQALLMQNGNSLINYGSTGVIREVTPDGEIVWEASTSSGSWFGQVTPFFDFYTGEHDTPSN
jgi:hypothetical protein